MDCDPTLQVGTDLASHLLPFPISVNLLRGENTFTVLMIQQTACMMNASHLNCLGEARKSEPAAGEDFYCQYSHVKGKGVFISLKKGTFNSPMEK